MKYIEYSTSIGSSSFVHGAKDQKLQEKLLEASLIFLHPQFFHEKTSVGLSELKIRTVMKLAKTYKLCFGCCQDYMLDIVQVF